MPEISNPYSAPEVQNKAPKPPGILPRNTQARVLGGIALLMVAVIAFSGRKPPKKTNEPSVKLPAAVDPSQARIQEYRVRIEEQTRKLAAEQAQLAEAKRALALPTEAARGPAIPRGGEYPASPAARSIYQTPSVKPERSWIEVDREKREYQSLYASNIVLSHRKESASPTETSRSRLPIPIGAERPPVSLQVPEEQAPLANSGGSPLPTPQDSTPRRAPKEPVAEGDELSQAHGKLYRLFEGTVLETVLTNRLDGSFSGPVNCMVTTNLYSHDGQRVLVPKGSRVLGDVRKVDGFGQQRLAVVFHRLIMPDGYSVNLDQFQGLNQVGETGLRDKVNRHYLQVFGVSLAIGAIAGLSQSQTRYGLETSAEDAYRQGVANSLSQSSLRILDRYLNVLPTFTIGEGHRVKIYLSQDMLLPAYASHDMPADI